MSVNDGEEEFTLLKFHKTLIRKPFFDPHPEKTTTENWSWRVGLFLIFEDQSGHKFIYMPSWKDIAHILEQKDAVEARNRELYAQNNKSYVT